MIEPPSTHPAPALDQDVLDAADGIAALARELAPEAERQRRIALARQLTAQAELLRGQQGHLLQRSVLLAIEALQRSPSLLGASYATLEMMYHYP